MIEYITYLLDFGPWAVMTYLLVFRFEKKLEENTHAMNEFMRYLQNGRNK